MEEQHVKWAMWLAAAYFAGAVPFGFLIGRMRGVDVRTVGSKNIGATNVFRTVGKKWGLLAFLCDFLKGFLPTLAAAKYAGCGGDLPVAAGLACVIGHTLTVFMKFKGGKGVSTALGLLFGVAPFAGLLGFAGWGIFFGLSRYVSLASCLAAVIVGGLMWSPLYAARPLWFAILITILALLAIVKHRTNLVRLCKGTENRFAFTAKQRAIRDAKRMQQEATK